MGPLGALYATWALKAHACMGYAHNLDALPAPLMSLYTDAVTNASWWRTVGTPDAVTMHQPAARSRH